MAQGALTAIVEIEYFYQTLHVIIPYVPTCTLGWFGRSMYAYIPYMESMGYIYIYIYVSVCVCMSCLYVCLEFKTNCIVTSETYMITKPTTYLEGPVGDIHSDLHTSFQ